MSKSEFHPAYPEVNDLIRKAKKRIPRFAFEYLSGGCNDEVNLYKNSHDFHEIELNPQYLRSTVLGDSTCELWGQTYSSPFGIAPIGLQGLMWPKSAEYLAKAAVKHQIPFILSTVSTASIESISEITEGQAWFQLYHPAKKEMRNDLIFRAKLMGIKVLVLLADTPVFGYRPKDIRNGLSMPPKMSLKNIFQITQKPRWAVGTLLHGQPQFASLLPYMPKGLNMSQLGNFMNQTFDGRLTVERIKEIRDLWPGKLVIKGIVNEEDCEKVIGCGADGIIVSNHGGRQLDAGESTIRSLQRLTSPYGEKITIMMDGGIRTGTDIARAISCGAKMVFMGRPFMYGVGALGERGAGHTIEMYKTQFQQILNQLGCDHIAELTEKRIIKK